MKIHGIWFLVLAFLLPVQAQVPQLINYQGRLIDGTNLVNGNVGLSLRLFNVPIDGASIYEDSNSVTVADGLYSTFIGDQTNSGNFASALTNAAVYVEVAINGSTLSPRERIASAAYALNVNAAGIAGTIADSRLSTNVARLNVPNTALQATGSPTTTNGFVVGATVTSGGSGYLTPPAVTVNDTNGVGAVVVSSISGGAVTGLAVQAAGSGYSTNATLTIALPPSNAYQTFGGVNFFTGVNTMNNVSNTFAGSFSGSFSGSGAMPWQVVSGTNVQAQPHTGYLLTSDALVTVTLPTTPAPGDVVRVAGTGAGGWKLAQNAGQSVLANNIPGNYGAIWKPYTTNQDWWTVASSADGSKLVAAVYASAMYTSSDSGQSWTARTINQFWRSVASSVDGIKLVGAVEGGAIYTSSDSGTNWIARTVNQSWRSVASSSDGNKLVAAVYGGQIYTSTDSGTNWTAHANFTNWFSVASSSDGNKLVAAVYGGQIYTSTNSGTNWVPRVGNLNWNSVASSSDGIKLVAAVDAGQIYTSTDSGANWTAHESSRPWTSVASSADGNKQIAVVDGGQIYTSTDSGVTWTPRESNRRWWAVALSSDGSKLVIVVNGGQIYTSTSTSTAGMAGYLLGDPHSAVELQYAGNGQFIPLSHEGSILSF